MASYSSLLSGGDDDVERCSLQQKLQSSASIKNKKKSNYGSLHTNKHEANVQTSTAFIVNYRHRLKAGETLQGISLRYGVPIENIKRANRLWSNDLAFIKDVLIVPIDKEKLSQLDFVDMSQVENNGNGNNNGAISSANHSNGINGDEKSQNEDDGYKDYLSKFDTFISQSKLKLKSLESATK